MRGLYVCIGSLGRAGQIKTTNSTRLAWKVSCGQLNRREQWVNILLRRIRGSMTTAGGGEPVLHFSLSWLDFGLLFPQHQEESAGGQGHFSVGISVTEANQLFGDGGSQPTHHEAPETWRWRWITTSYSYNWISDPPPGQPCFHLLFSGLTEQLRVSYHYDSYNDRGQRETC